MGAVTADLGAGENDLEAECGFNLAAQLLQRLAEVFFHFAAA